MRVPSGLKRRNSHRTCPLPRAPSPASNVLNSFSANCGAHRKKINGLALAGGAGSAAGDGAGVGREHVTMVDLSDAGRDAVSARAFRACC